MRPFITAPFLVFALACAGCTTGTTQMSFTGQAPVDQGLATAESHKTHHLTVKVLTPRYSGRTEELPTLLVSMRNGAGQPILFSTASLSVLSDNRPVRVYTSDEFGARLRNEARFQTTIAQMREAAENRKANEIMMVSRSPAVLPGRMAAADATQDTKVRYRTLVSEVRYMLYPKYVSPGETFGGVVKLHAEDIAPNRPLRLVVTVGDEVHEFEFAVNG